MNRTVHKIIKDIIEPGCIITLYHLFIEKGINISALGIKKGSSNMLYKTSGVCSTEINFEIDEESKLIKAVHFKGGCSGNASGISRLVVGMTVDEVITRLEGVKCGFRSTSCPDQLAKALKNWRG